MVVRRRQLQSLAIVGYASSYSSLVIDREEHLIAPAALVPVDYPAGVRLQGEYWPASTAPAVISIFEADGFSPLQELSLVWGDVFDITILPATTPEDGLRSGQEIMQRLGANR